MNKVSSSAHLRLSRLIFGGHSAVIIEAEGAKGEAFRIGIDPWFRGNPSSPLHLKNPPKFDLIVLTHGHSDHAGECVQWAVRDNCLVAATYELGAILIEEGISDSKVILMNKGGSVEVPVSGHASNVTLTLTHAFHSSSYDTDNRGTIYAGEACGVVLRDGETSIYHAGDTNLFSDMRLIGEMFKPDIAMLPIGDRFTMGPKEAAMSAKLVEARINIPLHYGTFPLLTGTAEEFERECGQLKIAAKTLKPGEVLSIKQELV